MKQQTTMSLPFSPQRGEKGAEGRMRGAVRAMHFESTPPRTPFSPQRGEKP